MEKLGQFSAAINTPGGAAGQVLTKNSAADNDASWQTVEAATAVSYAPQTLTPAQQGQALANIGAGLLAGFRNKIINGNFDVWQRAQSTNVNSSYAADRWKFFTGTGGAGSCTQQTNAIGVSEIPSSPANYVRLSRTTTGTTPQNLIQYLESVRNVQGRVTVTLYAKANKSATLGIEFTQNFGSGGSSSVTIGLGSFPLNTSWKKITVAFDAPSIVGKTMGGGTYCALSFVNPISNGNVDVDIARVSLVQGDATAEDDPFSPRHIQQETALCQRYYQIISIHQGVLQGAGGQMRTNINYSPMRAPPTIIEISAGTRINISSLIAGYRAPSSLLVQITNTSSAQSYVENYVISLDAEF